MLQEHFNNESNEIDQNHFEAIGGSNYRVVRINLMDTKEEFLQALRTDAALVRLSDR